MLEVKGKYNTAKMFTDNVDKGTIGQVMDLCNQEMFQNSKIAIMPDCHIGKGCTIGTTMTITDKVIPNLVGVDIGCGVTVAKIGTTKDDINFEVLDRVIRNKIPSGFNVHAGKVDNNFPDIFKVRALIDRQRAMQSIGTLGGGNHFIELAEGSEGEVYLIIHSGSRHMGKQIAEWYQDKLRDSKYLLSEDLENYLYDMNIAQYYASFNRHVMAVNIIIMMGWKIEHSFQSVHNYIDLENMILRKGAVSAQLNEPLIIPLNMRDGSILALGKGNPDWNYSAPHGAGRILSRSQAKKQIVLEDFKDTMKDVWSSSVLQSTVDEAPMAYKPMNEIIDVIGDTVEIIDVIKPIYNFKAN